MVLASTLIAAFTGITTVIAVFLAWRQLRAQNPDAEARRIELDVRRDMKTGKVKVSVKLDGQAKLHSAQAVFTDLDRECRLASDSLPVLSSTTPLEWNVDLTDAEIQSGWMVLQWAVPRYEWNGEPRLVAAAIRTKVSDPRYEHNDDRGIEVWHYRRCIRFLTFYNRSKRWWLPGSGHRRPVGRWRRYENRGYTRQQGPMADPSL